MFGVCMIPPGLFISVSHQLFLSFLGLDELHHPFIQPFDQE